MRVLILLGLLVLWTTLIVPGYSAGRWILPPIVMLLVFALLIMFIVGAALKSKEGKLATLGLLTLFVTVFSFCILYVVSQLRVDSILHARLIVEDICNEAVKVAYIDESVNEVYRSCRLGEETITVIRVVNNVMYGRYDYLLESSSGAQFWVTLHGPFDDFHIQLHGVVDKGN